MTAAEIRIGISIPSCARYTSQPRNRAICCHSCAPYPRVEVRPGAPYRQPESATRGWACADNLHLTDFAAASGRAVASIPAAVATFGLAVGFRVPAATLASCARAGCASTLFRFHRHWNLLFTLSWV